MICLPGMCPPSTFMPFMFAHAKSFNQPLSSWDVSAVNQMDFMFEGADCFNQTLSSWDFSLVMSLRHLFTGAVAFDQNSEWRFCGHTRHVLRQRLSHNRRSQFLCVSARSILPCLSRYQGKVNKSLSRSFDDDGIHHGRRSYQRQAL